ncbi:HlyD family efflux transporter periplasmic adaptor subunit [Christensenellaceae bacterium NSJ-63]|uniref:HlyD family efflux transporter periplasmic adaptor subunit n=1 Tax=Guopingia tenuis TaxID=2763656 RepID=A0A926HWA6_9FIRM|nr:biotin/lipoyl-binding protein [Guopingia tenuis]MBC8538819.1 HlyD family efflux transporter periplasmic adaptor subunit [Guopingia tenuis]
MKKDLFRKRSLESVSSPERLDEYIKVTHPGIWSVLIAFLAVVVAAVVWFAVGTIPDTLDIRGVVFPGDGTVAAEARESGRIQDMRVEVGDFVEPHDILAVVEQTELAAELESLKNAAEPDEAAIAAKQQELMDASVIRSEVYGVVLDAKHLGDMVNAGDAVASLARMEEGTNTYEILCYVPQDTAKRLEKGMEVQACPSYANREEVGYMNGYITEVGEYPVTEGDILAAVGDLRYVQEVMEEGNNVEVRVSIAVDASKGDAKNAARWSNAKGNDLDITTGTACDLLVVIKEQKAYELLLGS